MAQLNTLLHFAGAAEIPPVDPVEVSAAVPGIPAQPGVPEQPAGAFASWTPSGISQRTLQALPPLDPGEIEVELFGNDYWDGQVTPSNFRSNAVRITLHTTDQDGQSRQAALYAIPIQCRLNLQFHTPNVISNIMVNVTRISQAANRLTLSIQVGDTFLNGVASTRLPSETSTSIAIGYAEDQPPGITIGPAIGVGREAMPAPRSSAGRVYTKAEPVVGDVDAAGEFSLAGFQSMAEFVGGTRTIALAVGNNLAWLQAIDQELFLVHLTPSGVGGVLQMTVLSKTPGQTVWMLEVLVTAIRYGVTAPGTAVNTLDRNFGQDVTNFTSSSVPRPNLELQIIYNPPGAGFPVRQDSAYYFIAEAFATGPGTPAVDPSPALPGLPSTPAVDPVPAVWTGGTPGRPAIPAFSIWAERLDRTNLFEDDDQALRLKENIVNALVRQVYRVRSHEGIQETRILADEDGLVQVVTGVEQIDRNFLRIDTLGRIYGPNTVIAPDLTVIPNGVIPQRPDPAPIQPEVVNVRDRLSPHPLPPQPDPPDMPNPPDPEPSIQLYTLQLHFGTGGSPQGAAITFQSATGDFTVVGEATEALPDIFLTLEPGRTISAVYWDGFESRDDLFTRNGRTWHAADFGPSSFTFFVRTEAE